MEVFVCIQSAFKPWGYEQYPQDCKSVFKPLLKDAKKLLGKYDNDEIIIIRRIEHLLYYSYFRVLKHGGWIGIGVRCQEIFQDSHSLYAFFHDCMEYFSSKKCIIEGEKNNYKLLKGKIYGDSTTLGAIDAISICFQKNIDVLFLESDVITNYKEKQSGHPIGGRLNSEEGADIFSGYLKKGFGQVYILPVVESEQRNTNSAVWIVLAIIVSIILLNVIAPWFIPSTWSKLPIGLTVLGICSILKAMNEDSNERTSQILGWSGIFAILMSTVITIYGLCGGIERKVLKIENKPIHNVLQVRGRRSILIDAIKANDTTILKQLAVDSAYSDALAPLAKVLYKQGKYEEALKYAVMADKTDKTAQDIVVSISKRKIKKHEDKVSDILAHLSDNPDQKIKQLVKAKHHQDSIINISETYLEGYYVDKRLNKIIDMVFNNYVEAGDKNPVISIKIDCYEKALELKNNSSVREKLNKLKSHTQSTVG